MKTQELIAEVSSLPVEERALLADSLLKTLNATNPEIEAEWVTLAAKRLQELRTGKVVAVPGDEVFDKVWRRFGK